MSYLIFKVIVQCSLFDNSSEIFTMFYQMLRKLKVITVVLFETSTVSNKLDYLDGFRGVMALIVLISHYLTIFAVRDTEFRILLGFGTHFGLMGFFVHSFSIYNVAFLVIKHYFLKKSGDGRR